MSTTVGAPPNNPPRDRSEASGNESIDPNAGANRMRDHNALTYEFDVFLSCCEADKDWVESELLEPLLAAGVKVTWEWDFALGVDKIAARSEAVKNSRHTLIVLTKAWCDSPLTKDDALSARFLDPNTDDRKILPLLGEKYESLPECPDYLRRLTALDFYEALVRQATLPKLLNELGQSRQTVTEVMSQFAQKGIQVLIELMTSPEVRIAARSIEAAFVAARDEIDELSRCKQMHEYFHQADNEFQDFKRVKDILQDLLHKSPDEEEELEAEIDEAWVDLSMFINGRLMTCSQNLIALAATEGYRPEQVLWSPALARSIQELCNASENREIKPLVRASERFAQIIGEWPSRFDGQLHDAAQRLKLTPVVEGLSTIRESASRYQFQQDVAARLDVFSRGIAALSELGKRVQDLVTCHNCLQFISGIIDTFAEKITCDDDVEKIRYAFPDIEPSADKITPLSNPSWGKQFQMTRIQFSDTINTAPEDDIDAKTRGTINVSLRKFRTSVSTGFTQVDWELLGLCKKLQNIGLELTETIRKLQHE